MSAHAARATVIDNMGAQVVWQSDVSAAAHDHCSMFGTVGDEATQAPLTEHDCGGVASVPLQGPCRL